MAPPDEVHGAFPFGWSGGCLCLGVQVGVSAALPGRQPDTDSVISLQELIKSVRRMTVESPRTINLSVIHMTWSFY